MRSILLFGMGLAPVKPMVTLVIIFVFCGLSWMLNCPAAPATLLTLSIFWINLLVSRPHKWKGYLQITLLPSDFALTALQGNKVASSLMAGNAHWWPERSHTFTVPFLIHRATPVPWEPNDFSMCLVFLVLCSVFRASSTCVGERPSGPLVR